MGWWCDYGIFISANLNLFQLKSFISLETIIKTMPNHIDSGDSPSFTPFGNVKPAPEYNVLEI